MSPIPRAFLWIPPSIPGPIDSAISLGPANFNVPGEEKTVEHLTASGGSPPYRFYVVPEPDQAGVPYWFQLAADGTLILEPRPNSRPSTSSSKSSTATVNAPTSPTGERVRQGGS